MNRKMTFVLAGVTACSLLLAAGSSWTAVRLHRRVRAYESAAQDRADSGRPKPEKKASGPKKPPAAKPGRMAVTDVKYDGDRKLRIKLTERPDMAVVRQYIDISPMRTGALDVSYEADYDYGIGQYVPTLEVVGDFAHRTNVTLRLRKGLARYGYGADVTAPGALAEDYIYEFRRKDSPPKVRFATSGRYLPPVGAQTVGIRSVNHASLRAEIRRVDAKNVVQLLAREEGRYSSYCGAGGDSEDAEDLAGEATEVRLTCRNEVNEPEVYPVPVAAADGGPSNGVFLVTVGGGENPFDDRERIWDSGDRRPNPKYNPPCYRLVCVSDLGVSVRTAASGMGVWVTSLTRGTPVGGASVSVYSSANVELMSGTTDEDGWCRLESEGAGKPFAVVVRTKDADDMTFLALSDRMKVDEPYVEGSREDYLSEGDCTGFLWTERGIYRHGETIFAHLLLRTAEGQALEPFPVVLELLTPDGRIFESRTQMPDGLGALACTDFAVPEEQPDGDWTVRARKPGKDGKTLAEASVKVEAFAPPQVRVAVQVDADSPTNGTITVSAEHLFGGPATGMTCEGAVVFEDVPFAPADWEGYRFGDESRGLRPNFIPLGKQNLAGSGRAVFASELPGKVGLPKAAVRLTGQGVVFEDGGRPAAARQSAVLHLYPYYLGARLGDRLALPSDADALPSVALACVTPDGRRLGEARELKVSLARLDSVYACRMNKKGESVWTCERVRTVVQEDVSVTAKADGDTVLELPVRACGDYALTVTDPARGVSFGRAFYLCGADDGSVRAPLADPTAVVVLPDRAVYRPGDVPRLAVRAPFAGWAMVSVQHEDNVYTQILNLTNATSEVVLEPVTVENAPNLDVYVSVIQSVESSARRLAARAHGQATVCVRPRERELSVSLDAAVRRKGSGDGSDLTVTLQAGGVAADGTASVGDVAVVTVVDEGINLLTDEPTPDPVGHFAQPRTAEHPLFDLYGYILPVLSDDGLRVGGVKTGGGAGAEMLSRVSPVASRRFRPLALWQAAVPLSNGCGRVAFALPEFRGEVRVTAVAYSARAVGAASVRRKVVSRLVMQPDAPRFVAPGDVFDCTLSLHNRSGAAGEVRYAAAGRTGVCALAADGATNLTFRMTAPSEPGEQALAFMAEGFGERHAETIALPVRPAVAWVETAGVCPQSKWQAPAQGRWSAKTFASPLGSYEAALRWLADYPHGCLEQTCSRMFPLVAAGGVLNTVASNGTDVVNAGVRRVASMVRERNFVMWPDCDYPPWDSEVSVYAAHFLVAAQAAGYQVPSETFVRVLGFLRCWALDEKDENLSVHAALVLARAGRPERDRMFRLYDARGTLSALARTRLAWAFAELGDLSRARALLAESFEPQSVKEAAFAVRALLAVDPDDPRILPFVAWLDARRDRKRLSWGTTEENAHALMAVGAYAQAHPKALAEPLVSWRNLELPDLASVTNEASGLFLTRRYWRSDGQPADLSDLHRQDLLLVELCVTSSVARVVNDLVIEDLFAGAFEPVHREVSSVGALEGNFGLECWLLRHEARDDRMQVFSKRVKLEVDSALRFVYPVRVVSAGVYTLPGPSVEGMYNPRLRARGVPGRVVVRP